MFDSCRWAGRLFHTRGPAAANEQSLRCVLVRCANHVSMYNNRSCQHLVGNLPPDKQAGGHAVPSTPARRSLIAHVGGLKANVAAAGQV